MSGVATLAELKDGTYDGEDLFELMEIAALKNELERRASARASKGK